MTLRAAAKCMMTRPVLPLFADPLASPAPLSVPSGAIAVVYFDSPAGSKQSLSATALIFFTLSSHSLTTPRASQRNQAQQDGELRRMD